MPTVRRYLLAPSLARLIRKERSSNRVTEGYFPTQSGRNSHVHVEGGQCYLALVSAAPGESGSVERTEVPRAHGDALLDVCAGKAVYERVRLTVGGGREALVDRFSVPGPVDMVSVEFDAADEAAGFYPPPWFGPEVTGEPAYDNRALALQGIPAIGELPVSNAALDAVLDALEDRYGLSRYATRRTNDDTKVIDALRRLAMTSTDAPAPAPAPALAAPLFSPAPEEAAPLEEAYYQADPAEEADDPAALSDEARLDAVIAGLSQALETPAAPAQEPAAPQMPAAIVEPHRWQRARRSEG